MVNCVSSRSLGFVCCSVMVLHSGLEFSDDGDSGSCDSVSSTSFCFVCCSIMVLHSGLEFSDDGDSGFL